MVSGGTRIGTCFYAAQEIPVCIPWSIRCRHTHLIGRSGAGKSTTLECMILDDIQRNSGVAVLDPHGDLIERLLCLVPKESVDRVLYFDPGDLEWAPLWNPLTRSPFQDVARTADDLVGAIKNVVSGWGDRLEHLLRHAMFALLQLPNSTLLDVSNLLQHKSEQSTFLRERILQTITNETARRFWLYDFDRYRPDDFGSPKHKLSKLLVSGTVSMMLSQPENRLNFRQIMDEGQIFLANLSTIGSEVREILGSFLLSLLHITALSRRDIPPEKRNHFFIYCDEAHRFMTDTVEDLIAETRKFGIGLTLAHQYLSQFGVRKVDALANVGTTILFNVDTKDAHHLIKDLRGMVAVEDIIALDVGEAIARIGTDVVRFNTMPPFSIPQQHFKEQILKQSRERYYKPVDEVQKVIQERYSGNMSIPAKSYSEENETKGKPLFDEF